MSKGRITIAAAAVLALSGCADLSPTQQRTLTGTAIGTAGGAIIGAFAGNAGLGALAGAAAGTAGGWLFGQSKENERQAHEGGYQRRAAEEAQFPRAARQRFQGPVSW